MMSSKNVANAVGGKTARACDSCVRKRARWYCAADDAFLCQSCDASVHSANPLARRHERVRLKAASSLKHGGDKEDADSSVPSWHGGFKRKARTPRHGKFPVLPKSEEPSPRQMFPLVPEVGGDETTEENEDEQLLYRVPIYDPFVAELDGDSKDVGGREVKALLAGYGQDVDNLDGFLPSDMDLAEFAADVESLLGGGLESECYGIDALGLLTDCKIQDSLGMDCGKVKVEEEDDVVMGGESDLDMARETFELNFDYDSPATCGEEEEEKVAVAVMSASCGERDGEVGFAIKKRKILLNLDYESVISAWASQRSPWTTGSRPDIDADECWPDCMGSCGTDHHIHHQYGEMVMSQSAAVVGDGGREARVSRYREKRRTRLFSKKIRYEVRKLNAEKRPRMKGRFVKRASFVGTGTGTGSGSAAPAYPSLKK